MSGQSTDGRALRGARSRSLVLGAAVDLASLDGLEQLSFGRLAETTGLSKAGVQALFRTKEALQLATVAHARAVFTDAVITPAADLEPGAPRLRALVEGWIRYAEEPLFPGGCFWVATMSEQDSRPGPVRDALVEHLRAWNARLSRELGKIQPLSQGDLHEQEVQLAAFQLSAVLNSANTAMRLGDVDAGDHVRQTVDALIRRMADRPE